MDTQLQSLLTRVHASNIQRELVGNVLSAAVVFVGFWLASLLMKKVAEKFFLARKVDEALGRFLIRAVRLSLIVLGAVTALGTLGVNVSAMVAGLGLTGLALGIALKDTVSNAVSGVMLLLFRPFRHRDHIKVGEFEGTVEDIDLRYTHLKTAGRMIYVPNSMMFANAVSIITTPAVSTAGETKIKALLAIAPSEEAPPEPTIEQEAIRERPNLLLAIADERVAA